MRTGVLTWRPTGMEAHKNLKEEQKKTLSSPRMSYGLLARILFFTMDLFYGKKGTFSKFKVLEVIARVPYQAWEQVSYVAITHNYRTPDFARRIFEFVQESRQHQDNEQWHLFILEEYIYKKGIRENFILYRVVPQIIAFIYYHISWILYVIRPGLSYQLNAEFEDHAEHEYMNFVANNPQLEEEPFESEFAGDYGTFESVADLLRNIAVDERIHKEESLVRVKNPRFASGQDQPSP